MDVEFFAITSGLAAAMVGVSWLVRSRPDAAARLARDFARKVDLGLDPGLEERVRARLLHRERAAAVAGLLLAVAASVVASTLTADESWESYRLLAVFLGYLTGHATGYGVVAWRESARRLPADGPRLARASVPTHADYVARHERIGAWVVSAMSAAVGVAFLLADREGALRGAVPTGLAIAAVLGPAAAVVADEVLARRLLDRPQPATTPTELAWDDALRARTLRDMVTVPLVTGYLGMFVLTGVVGAGLPGGWPGTDVDVAHVAFLVLLGAGAVMSVVSAVLTPERHFRRRLWPSALEPVPALSGGPQ